MFLLAALVHIVICSYTKLTAGRAQMVEVGEVTLTAMISKVQSKFLNEALQKRYIVMVYIIAE